MRIKTRKLKQNTLNLPSKKQENERMTAKEEYKNICEEHKEIPVFSQYWWMEANCPDGDWDVFIFKDEKGKILGTMPYQLKKRLALSVMTKPVVSQHIGIHFFYPDNIEEDNYVRLRFEEDVCNMAIEEIDKIRPGLFEQNFPPSFVCHLPFYWAGFSQYTRYTYRLPDITNPETLMQTFCKSKQKHIRKAQKNGLHTDFDMGEEDFERFHRMTYAQRGEADLIDQTHIIDAIRAARKAGQGTIACTRDADGTPLSAFFLVWDSEWAYYIITGIDQTKKSSGAPSLMIWDAINFLQGKTHGFDFEGSMNQGIGASHREFGAEVVPFHHIQKYYSKTLRMINRIRGCEMR